MDKDIEKPKKPSSKVLDLIESGLSHLVPKGGIKHPDSLITRGRNRSLFISPGKVVSPIPGLDPKLDKSLLVGSRRLSNTDGLDHFRKMHTSHVHKKRKV